MSETGLDRARSRLHPNCVACSPIHPTGFRLHFEEQVGGGVAADFACGDAFEGYPGWLHGGVISLLFDSSMATCMFTEGYEAVTAELAVRFKEPVAIGHAAHISARVQKDMHPLYLIEATLSQDEVVKAQATGKFMVRCD